MATIAIFDSGVGGLSIYQRIKLKLPDCKYVFVSDNEAYPYGTKSEDELLQRVPEVVARIIKQYQPDILIVACNTASTVVLPLLREQFKLPIVGVVPAIKPACKISKTKHIGLLATPGTIKRSYTELLIKQYAADCTITKVGSSKLVELAEQKLYGGIVDLDILKAEVSSILNDNLIDIVVLACTHFPLLNNEIRSLFNVNNHKIELINSGDGIAKRVVTLVKQEPHKDSKPQEAVAVFTKTIDQHTAFINTLKQFGLEYRGCLKA